MTALCRLLLRRNRLLVVGIVCSLVSSTACAREAELQNVVGIEEAPQTAAPGDFEQLRAPYVPLQDREGKTLALVKDLEISDVSDPINGIFVWITDIVVDQDRKIYVSDRMRKFVQVFDSQGAHVWTLGDTGQGPGSIRAPDAMAIVGSELVVSDTGRRRFIIWNTRTGELIGDRLAGVDHQVFFIEGVGSGRVGAKFDLQFRARQAVGILTVEGRLEKILATFSDPRPPSVSTTRGSGTEAATVSALVPIGTASSWFTVGPEHIYVTEAEEYDIRSFSITGEPVWRVQVPWPRAKLEQHEIEVALETLGSTFANLDTATIEWADSTPALSTGRLVGSGGRPLRVDGHGHLYVFPHIPAPWAYPDRWRPVDVYSPAGELLFAGLIENKNWLAAADDHVYGTERNAAGELVVVRYKLSEPF